MESTGKSSSLKSPEKDMKRPKRPILNYWKCSGKDLLERLVVIYYRHLYIYMHCSFYRNENISTNLDEIAWKEMN